LSSERKPSTAGDTDKLDQKKKNWEENASLANRHACQKEVYTGEKTRKNGKGKSQNMGAQFKQLQNLQQATSTEPSWEPVTKKLTQKAHRRKKNQW